MSCPICKKPVEKTYAPFCSRRCADLDLWRWLNGAYAVPSDDDLPEEFEGSDWPAENGQVRH